MYRLKRDNVERIADSMAKRNRLISEGFRPVEEMSAAPPEDESGKDESGEDEGGETDNLPEGEGGEDESGEDEGGENETQQEKVKKAGRQRIKQQDKDEEKERQEAGGELNGVPDKA